MKLHCIRKLKSQFPENQLQNLYPPTELLIGQVLGHKSKTWP